MSEILANKEIRNKLYMAFPESFVNMNYEFIAYPKANTYFRLEDVNNELDLQCKVIAWLSREAAKSLNRYSKKYHFEGINNFLNTNFTTDEMKTIYTSLGGDVDRDKCIKFIQSGFDMSVLEVQNE